MSKKHSKSEPETGSKPLKLTPQIPVAIHGEYPNQFITIENPLGMHRGKIVLTPENAYSELMTVLMAKAGEIELERQLAEERRNKAPKRRAQPDWRLIAQHPEATIIERLPTISPQLTAKKSEHTLEEMGL